jgi:hypothetical protein
VPDRANQRTTIHLNKFQIHTMFHSFHSHMIAADIAQKGFVQTAKRDQVWSQMMGNFGGRTSEILNRMRLHSHLTARELVTFQE